MFSKMKQNIELKKASEGLQSAAKEINNMMGVIVNSYEQVNGDMFFLQKQREDLTSIASSISKLKSEDRLKSVSELNLITKKISNVDLDSYNMRVLQGMCSYSMPNVKENISSSVNKSINHINKAIEIAIEKNVDKKPSKGIDMSM